MTLKRNFTRQLLLSVICAGASSICLAEPQIQSVKGQLLNGAKLSISGNNFSSANAIPALYDHVDNQSEFSTLSDGSVIPEDRGPWTHNTSIYGNPITIARNGDLRTPDSKAVYEGRVKSYLGWPRSMQDTETKTLYVSWWYKPSQTVDQGGSNKFLRIWDDSSGNNTRISWTQMHMIYDALDLGYIPPTSWATTQPDPGTWNRLEIYADADAGAITASLNGDVKHKLNDFKKSPTYRGLTVALVGFDPSIKDNYPNYSFRMTDIYVSETQARVEISDSPTWDPTSHREVLNVNSWSDQSIDVTFNLYAHKASSSLYLYVIDNNGSVNANGYQLCEKCPSQVQSITIE
ncbi:MAG: hypothetical protein R6W86_08195 [Marinobacter sp.]|uniref:hypothetical protein n=1 Tax=Marinobacter sp. TaxID=50741 RepID=UPI00396E1496